MRVVRDIQRSRQEGSLDRMRLTEVERRSAREALSALVGLPLSDMWRYMGCQKFEFGEQKQHVNRKGEETTWADWGLVANCRWRVQGPDGFSLTWEHFGPTPERRDDHADPFYDLLEANPPVVESTGVEEDGGLRIGMTGGYSLALDPRPYDEDHIEEWRLMPPEDDPRGHLVLDGETLSWSRATIE